ncbi:MFS transporter [Legionella quateirensis]|uniref:Major facilitator superfamily protein n=1 Tax=Legionella quateirensis TaxID=45072 RepID=A0A378KXS3_9GAMM|nr:MFS transporter [Legionella quateirensis]KTD49249.1 major facilitator superfamily transporter protein [Legionella quateirensis]STY19345.1 major facilitator superfamily protein [Legionella quateirensis]
MLIRNIQLFIVIASSILTLVATDILLPSLPQIAQSFAVPSNDVKMIISIFMIGQFATVLIWGIIADLIGRRQTLFIGMVIFFIGSILSLYADSINLLLACRFLQGTGAVVVPVAGWALIQDLYHKDDGARIMSWIGTLVAALPLFAPAIGGKVDVLYGWQMNLYGIAIYSTILCMIMIFLPKHPSNNTIISAPDLKERVQIYGMILKNKTFISYIALFGLLNCGEWCFLTMAPFYYSHVHVSPDKMGLLLMLTSMGFLFGSMLASKLFTRFGVDKTISLGIHIAIISSGLLLAGNYFGWCDYQIFNALDLSMYIFSSALLWGGTTSRALQCFDEFRGSASAVRSLILLCFSAFGTYSGRLLNHESLFPVGIVLFVLALCTLFVFNNKELKAERLAAEAVY